MSACVASVEHRGGCEHGLIRVYYSLPMGDRFSYLLFHANDLEGSHLGRLVLERLHVPERLPGDVVLPVHSAQGGGADLDLPELPVEQHHPLGERPSPPGLQGGYVCQEGDMAGLEL